VQASIAQEGASPITFKELTTVPSMLVAARKFKHWTAAFSILVPAVLEINAVSHVAFPGVDARIVMNQVSEENYIGLSAGRKITRSWDWGVGVHVLRNKESEFTSVTGVPTGGGSVWLTQVQRKELEVFSLLLMTGFQKQVSRSLRFGLNMQTESLKLSGRAKVYQEQVVDDSSDGIPPSRTLVDRTFGANAKMPWQLLTGIEWTFRPGHRWLFDTGLSLPSSNHSIPGSELTENDRSRTTLRASTAYAYELNREWQVTGGVQFNPSTVSTPDEADLNFLGLTVGVYQQEGNVKSGFGAFYINSRTNTDFFGPAPNDPSSLKIYGLILSSSITY
jgi:hypothetical protein